MKKITLFLLLLVAFNESFSQNVSDYIFNQNIATYTPITGGTVLGNDATDDQRFYDPATPLGGSNFTGVGFPIGFNFTFNGYVYDRFAINANGWICFGSSLLTPSVNMNTTTSYTPLASVNAAVTNELVARVAGMTRDLQSQAGGELRFEVLGTAPNQTLVVQWTNYKKYNQSGDLYNFQIRLSQSTNSVSIVFGAMTSNTNAGVFQSGLRASPNSPNSNFNNRTTTTDWSAATAGTNASNTLLLSAAVFPVSGLTYTWTPPANCDGLPAPGNTISSVSSTCVNANFNLSLQNSTTGSAVNYQWQSSQDGVSYASILSAISPILTISQSSATYYRCIVTCTATSQSAISIPVYVSLNATAQCFCTPTYTTGKTEGDLISNIQISGTTLSNNSGTSPLNPAYTYFTGSPNYTGTLQAGSTYNVNVSVGTFGLQNVAVWIDYNDDGIFDTTERVGFSTTSIAANSTATFPISLVCNPPLGLHRMRVRDVYNISGINIDPCSNYGFGETEDYDITIGTPAACPQPSNLGVTAVTSSSASLTWNIGCTETQWDAHIAVAGSGLPTGLPSNPNVASGYNVTSLSPATNYEFYVRANCAANGYSVWTGPFTFSTLALPPVNDNCSSAIQLVVGNVFATNAISTTNVSATNSDAPTPGCASFLGGDVWFTVAVPASGKMTIETNPLAGSAVTDTGIAIYSGDCSALTLIECDDNDSASGNFSLLSLTNRTPGEILYVNAWEFGNDVFGTFQIAAYDCTSTTPAPTGNSSQVFCSAATVGDLFVEGSAIKWYDASTAGNLLSENDNLVSGTEYYASQTINCESFNRFAVTAIVSTSPVVSNTSLEVCDNNSDGFAAFNLTNANASITSQSGLTFSYFTNIVDAENGINPILNATAYTNTINPAVVFVRVANEFGCYNIAELILNVTTTLAPTGPENQSYCDATVGSLQAVGNTIQWYDSASGGTPLAPSTVLINSTTYYATQTENGCESGDRLAVLFTDNCAVLGCLSDPNGQYPFFDYTPDCVGLQEVIAVDCYTGEYSFVNVNLGTEYIFSSSVGTDFITIGNEAGTTVLASGIGSVTWTSNLTGLIRFYTHLNSSCDFSIAERSRMVQCGTILPPPANDDCSGLITLTAGGAFTDSPVTVSNGGATASTGVADPQCSSYLGGDIWYSVVVPASGTITIETATSDDSVTDTAIEVYTGNCTNLAVLDCNDDNDTNLFSILNLTGLNPGETLTIRTFSYDNDEIGTYQLAAYDASLAIDSFNNSNFKFYPNPVKDVLNLSTTSLISRVQVINILGQEVKTNVVNSTETQVDMNTLPSGTYLVKVTTDGLVKTIKVIKQ